MDKEIIDFIEEHEELIDADEWEEVYRILWRTQKYQTIGAFTEAILSAGINPLEYLDYIPDGYLYKSTITKLYIPSHITKIDFNAFKNSKLENIIFEKGSQLARIGGQAFRETKNLKSITIPASVTIIGVDAFSSSSLENIIFEEGSQLTGIDRSAFENTANLKSINIPSNVTSIGSYAFHESGLESIDIPSSVTHIGSYAFYNSGLKSVIIPSSVTRVDDYIFSGADNITIYCEAESQPDGWHPNWKYSNNKVIWGYKEA